MPDLRVPALPVEAGGRLNAAAYDRDFGERFGALRNAESWKLERLQHFEEESPAGRRFGAATGTKRFASSPRAGRDCG
jgi:hypothetical protein